MPEAPRYIVASDVEKRARLDCISHLLSRIPYEDLTPAPIELDERPPRAEYDPPRSRSGTSRRRFGTRRGASRP